MGALWLPPNLRSEGIGFVTSTVNNNATMLAGPAANRKLRVWGWSLDYSGVGHAYKEFRGILFYGGFPIAATNYIGQMLVVSTGVGSIAYQTYQGGLLLPAATGIRLRNISTVNGDTVISIVYYTIEASA